MLMRCILIGLAISLSALNASEDVLSTRRDTRSDVVYDYKVEPAFLQRIPQWGGPPQDVPLPIGSAIRNSVQKAKEKNIALGSLRYVILAKRTLSGDRDVWAYSITFMAQDDENQQGTMFVVLLDGTVILPTIREQ